MATKTKPKPRLSMKLLWKLGAKYELNADIRDFLEFVEREMKPLKEKK